MEKRQRNYSLDLIRSIALFTVVSVHFFKWNGFYSQPIVGKRMFVMLLMRTAFMVCVPLFILLTGYLMERKKLSRQYYTGITKTLGIYVLSSIACTLFKWLYLHKKYKLIDILFDLLGFSGAEYAWYVNMYIGLFLLIPFLNSIYQNLISKKQKQILLLTLLFLTVAPSVLNIYNFRTTGWWQQPSLSTKYAQIIPNWWGRVYPITYYFFGCYLKEYGLKLKKGTNLFLLFLTIFFQTLFMYYRSYATTFMKGAYEGWSALPTVISAILFFNLLKNVDLSQENIVIKKIIKQISDLSFGAYLLSFIFDKIFYPILNNHVPFVTDRLNYYPLVVPLIFVCSLIASYVVNILYTLLAKAISGTGRFLRKNGN